MGVRGVLSGSVGAATGAVMGGLIALLVHRRLDPQVEVTATWLLAPEGVPGSVLLLGAGVGLLLGCGGALWARRHNHAWLTPALVLAVLPFATPLVRLVGTLGWWAAALAGGLVVTGAVAGVRWLLLRCDTTSPDGPAGVSSNPYGARDRA